MFCSKCGQELVDGALFCAKCGQKVGSPVKGNNGASVHNNYGGSQCKRSYILDPQPEEPEVYKNNATDDTNENTKKQCSDSKKQEKCSGTRTETVYRPCAAPHTDEDSASLGLIICSVLFPIIGIIAFLVYHDTKPKRAKTLLCWSLGTIAVLVLLNIMLLLFGSCAILYY